MAPASTGHQFLFDSTPLQIAAVFGKGASESRMHEHCSEYNVYRLVHPSFRPTVRLNTGRSGVDCLSYVK